MGKVQRINVDGSNFKPNLITGLNSPKYVALDVDGGKVYWTENPGNIRRANLNGSNVETFATTLGDVGGIAVAESKIYWAEKTGERTGKISSLNLNGSNPETLVTLSSGVPISIAVDTEESKLYWTNSTGKIQYANFNDKSIQNIITNLSSPGYVVVGTSLAGQLTLTVNQPADVNKDGKVDQNDLLLVIKSLGQSDPANSRLDVDGDENVTIADLVLVAEAFENTSNAAAPMSGSQVISIDPDKFEFLIRTLQTENHGLLAYQKTLFFLHSLLKVELPNKTALFPNYPNPFNPETWIPYQLVSPSDVSIAIYSSGGKLVRQLNLGHQPVGIYRHRTQAAYWDGKNEVGEPVASGIYFYTFTAGNYHATRRMLIRK